MDGLEVRAKFTLGMVSSVMFPRSLWWEFECFLVDWETPMAKVKWWGSKGDVRIVLAIIGMALVVAQHR